MAFLCRAAKGTELVISYDLKAMFGQQLEALQLHSNYPFRLGLVVQLQCFHSLRIQGVIGHKHFAQISFHDLFLSPWLSHTTPCQHCSIQAT